MATNRLVQKGKVDIYATTLFEAANNDGGQDSVVEVRNQIARLLTLIWSDMDLTQALSNPDYTPEQRLTLARGVFADVHPALREVVAIMAQNGDAELLTRVYHAYEEVVAQKLNLCVVDVKTVVPLDDNLRQLIKDKTEADLGCKAVLNESIDKSILGGIIMSVNGKRIDASVISQLNKARYLLKETDGGDN